jgi:hypothetical protein
MPRHSVRTNYPAVAFTLTVIAILGLTGRALKIYVPPGAYNDLASSSEDYLQAGARQDIKWHELSADAFKQAQREHKIVLLVIGDVCNRSARDADYDAFADRDVTDSLRSRYVCIRVDASENTGWAFAFLPYRRTNLSAQALFQMHFFTPTGEWIHSKFIVSPSEMVNREWVLAAMRTAEDSLSRMGKMSDFVDLQRADQQMLDLPAQPLDHASRLSRMKQLVPEPQKGYLLWAELEGKVAQVRQVIDPFALEYFWRLGEPGLARQCTDAILRSPMIDWLDGGIFSSSGGAQWESVQFDKFAVTNIEFALWLAKMYVITGEEYYKSVAKRTVNFVLDELGELGSVRAYRVGDENELNRSLRSSLSVRVLRNGFDPAQRQWLRDNAKLDPQLNPQMIPQINDLSLIDKPEFQAVLETMDKIKSNVKRTYGGEELLEPDAISAATVSQIAWLLNDKDLLARCGRMIDDLHRFRVSTNSLFHCAGVGSRAPTTLADSLAYCDAMLQDFLHFGRQQSLSEGARILIAALKDASTDRPGELVETPPVFFELSTDLNPGSRMSDAMGESSIAKTIRLCHSYASVGRLLPVDYDVNSLDQMLDLTTARYSTVAGQLLNRVNSFFLNELLAGPKFIFSYGQNADEYARRAMVDHPNLRVLTIIGAPTMKVGITEPGTYLYDAGAITKLK